METSLGTPDRYYQYAIIDSSRIVFSGTGRKDEMVWSVPGQSLVDRSQLYDRRMAGSRALHTVNNNTYCSWTLHTVNNNSVGS